MKSIGIKTEGIAIVLICLMVSLHSCSVSKRVYRKGYHVQWNNSNQKLKSNPQKVIDQENIQDTKIFKEAKFQTETISVTSSKDVSTEDTPLQYEIEQDKITVKQSTSIQNGECFNYDDSEKSNSVKLKNDQEEKTSSEKLLLWSKILIISGVVLVLISSIGANINPLFRVFNAIAWLAVIVGVIFKIIGHKKQKKEEGKVGKSEEAKRLLKLGMILLLVGICFAVSASFLFTAINSATGPDPVAEVLGVILGTAAGYLLGFIAGILILLGIIQLIRGWVKE